jgi:hypothetical protein
MMDLFATHTWVLAQEGSEAAVNVIENALQLTQSTIESWNDTWAQTITPSSALWVTIVDFSRGLLALTFLYMFIRFGSEVMKSRYIGTVVELFTFPLIVLLFLGGDGRLLSNIILFIRSLGYTLVTGLLNQQLLGYTLEGAVKQFGLNNLGVQRIKQLYAECEGLVGDPFQQCWNSKARKPKQSTTISRHKTAISTLAPWKALYPCSPTSPSLGASIALVMPSQASAMAASMARLSASFRTASFP